MRRQVGLRYDVVAEIPAIQFVGVATADAKSGCLKDKDLDTARISMEHANASSRPMCSFLWCLPPSFLGQELAFVY